MLYPILILAVVSTSTLQAACDEPFGPPAHPLKQELTAEIWDRYSPDKQADIINELDADPLPGMTGFTILSRSDVQGKSPEALHEDAVIAHAIHKALEAATSEVDREEIEQSVGPDLGYVTIGEPSAEVHLLYLNATKQVLGAYVYLHQQGAMKEDGVSSEDFEYSFDTSEEAEAAGFDTGADVSWSATIALDAHLEPFPGAYYYEWSGH